MCFGPELLLLGKSECPILSLIGKIQVGSLELCSVVKFIFCFSMIVPQCTKHGWMSLVRKNLTRPPTQSTLNKKRDCKQPTSASDGTSGLLFKWAKKKKKNPRVEMEKCGEQFRMGCYNSYGDMRVAQYFCPYNLTIKGQVVFLSDKQFPGSFTSIFIAFAFQITVFIFNNCRRESATLQISYRSRLSMMRAFERPQQGFFCFFTVRHTRGCEENEINHNPQLTLT